VKIIQTGKHGLTAERNEKYALCVKFKDNFTFGLFLQICTRHFHN